MLTEVQFRLTASQILRINVLTLSKNVMVLTLLCEPLPK